MADRTIDRTTTVNQASQCTVYNVTMKELEAGLAQVDREAIRTAATSWYSAATKLGELANRLLSKAGEPLAKAWTAPSSNLSQQQLRYAQATARSLANECMQMAHAMDYTAKVADWYANNTPKRSTMQTVTVVGATVAGGIPGGLLADNMVDGQLDEAASQHLTNFMQRYRQVVSDALPPEVKLHLTESGGGQDPGIRTTGPGGPVGPTTSPKIPGGGSLDGVPFGDGPGGPKALDPGALPGGDGTGVPGADFPGGGAGIGGGGSPIGGPGDGSLVGGGIDPYGSASQLSGGGSLAGIGGPLTGAGGLGTLPGGGLAGIGDGLAGPGGMLGAGGLGAAGLRGGGSGLGRGGLAGGSLGVGAEDGGLGARGAGVAGQGRAGMSPMMGGHGAGGEEEERERSTWLSEDDDVWGGNGPAAPPLITS